MSVTALILTAGHSSRMGYPKAWLTYKDEPLLKHIVRSALDGGCDHAIIVVGKTTEPNKFLEQRQGRAQPHAASEVHLGSGRPLADEHATIPTTGKRRHKPKPMLDGRELEAQRASVHERAREAEKNEVPTTKGTTTPSVHERASEAEKNEVPATKGTTAPSVHERAREAENLVTDADVYTRLPEFSPRITCIEGEPTQSPIDSIRKALPHVPQDSAVLLWPIDHPFGDKNLVASLIQLLNGDKSIIVAAEVNGRLAHPPIIGADVVPELKSDIADQGARGVIRADPSRIRTLARNDTGLLLKLNTPESAHAADIRNPGS